MPHGFIFTCEFVCEKPIIWYFLFLLADQIVDANNVNEICTKYSVLWRQIGLKLGLDASVLDNVEADCHVQRKRFEVTLSKWMRLAGNNATWCTLELAITNANREDLSLGALSECKIQILYMYCMYILYMYICTYIRMHALYTPYILPRVHNIVMSSCSYTFFWCSGTSVIRTPLIWILG